MKREYLNHRQFIAPEFRLPDESMDKRVHCFDERFQHVDERFQRIDEQFELMNQQFERMNQQFDRMDGQFDRMDGQFDRMDGQFDRVDGQFDRMNEQFDRIDQQFEGIDAGFERINQRFERINEHFDRMEGRIYSLEVQLENIAAIARHGRLRRMHEPIQSIKVRKPVPDTNQTTWTAPRSMPKYMKQVYLLGQHAQGIFEGSWEGKTSEEKSEAKRQALETIRELADFYQVTIYSDEASESDAIEVILVELHVDEYMEAILDEWGIDWQKLCRLGKQHMQSRPQQVGVKRLGDTSIEGERQARQEQEEEPELTSD